MQRIKEFLSSKIPLWLVLGIFALAGIAAMLAIVYFRVIAYQYTVYLSAQDGSASRLEYGARPELQNANFFMAAKQKFIEQGASFIEADLSAMKISVYKDGAAVFEAPILTKGREGSWWETPAGLYQIESKEKNHFSSMGHVYQPWSMVFQGNFFIHGWPYYPDGTPVASTYSGGCIRLADKDAETIYNLTSAGMPVLVYEEDFIEDTFVYAPKTPIASAESYLAADLHSNYVFTEKEPEAERSIASLTKLMTALIATEYINIEKELTITQDMIIPTSHPRLTVGRSISVYQLLYPLLLESSNEAAEAIARVSGRERFISLMNKKAAALGMAHTHFADPSGVSGANVSTTEDYFLLAKYLYNNRRFILDMTSGRHTNAAYERSIFTDLDNFNIFEGDPTFVGGKTGKSTPAEETIISLFEMDFQGTVRPVVVIAFGADDPEVDVRAIRSYITDEYTK